MFTDHLIEILEVSVRYGEQPLTNKWLLNILKIAERRVKQEQAAERSTICTKLIKGET